MKNVLDIFPVPEFRGCALLCLIQITGSGNERPWGGCIPEVRGRGSMEKGVGVFLMWKSVSGHLRNCSAAYTGHQIFSVIFRVGRRCVAIPIPYFIFVFYFDEIQFFLLKVFPFSDILTLYTESFSDFSEAGRTALGDVGMGRKVFPSCGPDIYYLIRILSQKRLSVLRML